MLAVAAGAAAIAGSASAATVYEDWSYTSAGSVLGSGWLAVDSNDASGLIESLGGDVTGIGKVSYSYTAGDTDGVLKLGSFTYTNFKFTTTNLPPVAEYYLGELGHSGVFSISAAPEPATWAMLILGVAMTGFGLRRRKAAVALAA